MTDEEKKAAAEKAAAEQAAAGKAAADKAESERKAAAQPGDANLRAALAEKNRKLTARQAENERLRAELEQVKKAGAKPTIEGDPEDFAAKGTVAELVARETNKVRQDLVGLMENRLAVQEIMELRAEFEIYQDPVFGDTADSLLKLAVLEAPPGTDRAVLVEEVAKKVSALKVQRHNAEQEEADEVSPPAPGPGTHLAAHLETTPKPKSLREARDQGRSWLKDFTSRLRQQR